MRLERHASIVIHFSAENPQVTQHVARQQNFIISIVERGILQVNCNMNEIGDKLRTKDTRWDRIRKRHMNVINVKTETVKKFIELDYIGQKNMKILNGDDMPEKNINPALVMNLRHEMIERIARKKRDNIFQKQLAAEKAKEHNHTVEEHYIESQLDKFKTELQKARPKKILRPKLSLNLDNQSILKSLENCKNHISDFYKTPAEAIEEVVKISDNVSNGFHCNAYTETISNGNQDYSATNSKTSQAQQERCVRFEESVKVISYTREGSTCSNTSEDVDSVVSEFVDEVVNEPEQETHLEMVGKHVETMPYSKSKQCEGENPIKETTISKNTCHCDEFQNYGDQEECLTIIKLEPESHVKLVVEIHTDEESSKRSESESESNEQNAIIADLFRPKFQQNEVMLRKFFLKWIHFTTIEKIEKQNFSNKTDRIQKINAFLDKMRREKHRIPRNQMNNVSEKKENSVITAKKYQNKIKIQQDIIELQRLKLERQERMIMELKLTKLSEEARQAKQDMKAELKYVIRTGDKKNRSKAKYLQLVANLRDEDDDEFAQLQGKALMMPKFLAKMQERALQRSIKHEQAKQRRLQLEAEKEAAKIAAEEAKRLEDEEAKRQRIEALKEKRKQEKIAKLQKERERERYLENNKKCLEFSRRRLLRCIGMKGFKNLITLKRKNYKTAEIFRKHLLKKKIFLAWKSYYFLTWEKRMDKAKECYNKIVSRLAYRAWILYISMERSKLMVAIDWYELKLSELVFHRWVGLMKLAKIIEDSKIKQAQSHFHWHLKWKILDRWQRLPQILKLEKETEERRQRWRMKIWELLPDYTPNLGEDL